MEKTLRALPKLDSSVSSDEIRKFYDVSKKMVQQNAQILALAASHPHGAKSLGPGRVVMLRDGVR